MILVLDFDGPIFSSRRIAQEAIKNTLTHFHGDLGSPSTDISNFPLLSSRRMISLLYSDYKIDNKKLDEIKSYYKIQLKLLESKSPVSGDVHKFLKIIYDFKIPTYLFSERKELDLKNLAINLGINKYFKQIFGRDSFRIGKPSGEGLREIARIENVDTKHLLFVGNSDADYYSSKDAGVLYYHLTFTGEPSSVAYRFASRNLDSYEDLLEVIHSLKAPPIKTNTFPQKLQEAIKKGEFSLYGGAGVSIPSGLGGWSDHYLPILEKLNAKILVDNLQLEDGLQLLAVDPEVRKHLFDEFRMSFDSRKYKPNEYHYSFLNSGAKYIWTSNYDNLFEKCIGECGDNRRVIVSDSQLLDNFATPKSLIKMNGDFFSAEYDDSLKWNIAFTQEQFDFAEHDRKEIWRLFEDVYRNTALVFVGVSFKDSALRRITSLVRSKVKRTKYDHYFLTIISKDPIEMRRNNLHAKNLLRLGIQTLFFDDYREILSFVKEIAFQSICPSICVSGSVVEVEGAESVDRKRVLPNGNISLEQIAHLSGEIGRTLALDGYKVISGGAPFVGVQAVESAFEVSSNLGKFYLREKREQSQWRNAPAVIVKTKSYSDMRKVLINDALLLICIGGRSSESGTSGVIEEINLGIERELPILLLPQAGGVCCLHYESILKNIDEVYSNKNLRSMIIKKNRQIAALSPEELLSYLKFNLLLDIKDLLFATLSKPLLVS